MDRKEKLPREQQLYKKVIFHIDRHLDRELSLESLAGEFYVNKYHIAHIFKAKTGITVHQYVLKSRLEACKNEILDDQKASEVCFKYGFKDYSGFYRAFKKEYGMSPREWKDQIHGVMNL